MVFIMEIHLRNEPGFLSKNRLKIFLAALFILSLFIFFTTRISIKGRFEGIFLLKGGAGRLFEVKDYLYLGDGSRLITCIDFESSRCNSPSNPSQAHLDYSWDEKDGTGYVRNFFPGGGQIVTCFSRYGDQEGHSYHGLFVGGGLPDSVKDNFVVKLNETGMAYNNGKRWFHLWCTVNEMISPAATMKVMPPSDWKFLGSELINKGCLSLAIKSSHEVDMDGVPFRIDRYAYFRAGEPYFILSIWITNRGDRPASFYYCYGDEPWVGDYGTSKGNVGWVKDKLIQYSQYVDTDKYSYAGFFDYGNSANGSPHNFTDIADFIEWLGKEKPAVFFTNGCMEPVREGEPLKSDERFIGLQWGPRTLNPGESVNYPLAIGMAGNDPVTHLPVKPKVRSRISQ